MRTRKTALPICLPQTFSQSTACALPGYKAEGSRIGVLSAVIDGMDCVDAASRLNSDYHIAVRSGYHCSYIAHETIGTAATGTIRFSFGAFNTIDEVKRTAFAVSRIAKRLYFLG